jgi:excisionase family DNA binding protein
MSIDRVAGVLLTPDDADYIARALQLLDRLLRENGSTPTPRLQSVTAKLAKCAETGSAAGSNGRTDCRFGASHADSDQHAGYALISTSDAARLLNCGERNVRDLAARGRLRARRSGGCW